MTQVCHVQLTLSEFDKGTVELIPDQMLIPKKMEIAQHIVEETGVTLDYINKGNF